MTEELPIENRLQTELQLLSGEMKKIRDELSKVIVGQQEVIDHLLIGLLSGGHILLEGVPGIAKTLLARLLARSIVVKFARIQFTPDLMPTDVTGTSVFNQKITEFTFNRGPIFAGIVLIDEINRAPAKTQASLFEVMEERQVTVDGHSYQMDKPFMVIATQNPIEHEGTYKLPEAQLDRFLFRVKLRYPNLEEEVGILKRFKEDFMLRTADDVRPVCTAEQIIRCQEIVQKVHIKDELIEYIARITDQTRTSGDLLLGASPRASLAVLRASKTAAALLGRDFVTPDDIQYVLGPVLNHRIILTPEKELEGFEPEDVIREIVQLIEVPR